MNKWLWTLAIVITLASVVYQRVTGPSYPVHLNKTVDGVTYKGRLPRTHGIDSAMPVAFTADGAEAGAVVTMEWRLYPTEDPWTLKTMNFADGSYRASIPPQPAAGKVEYRILVATPRGPICISGAKAVVARYKGSVPPWILAPHILLMFLGMLWSVRTGLEAAVGGERRARLAWTTLALLFVGGLILGPIVQKNAFGVYWSGWPFGGDLTDNKLAIAVLFWVVAALSRGRDAWARVMTIVAAVVVLGVYMIPHSMNGSTLDPHTGVVETGRMD